MEFLSEAGRHGGEPVRYCLTGGVETANDYAANGIDNVRRDVTTTSRGTGYLLRRDRSRERNGGTSGNPARKRFA